MKKSSLVLLSLILVTNLLSFAFISPAVAQQEIGSLISEKLEPINKTYGGEDVTSRSLPLVISRIIQTVLLFLGLIFIILIIYAGFTWMTSAGNEEKITKAKKTMVAAIIGVAIVLAAYAITYFVLGALLEATGADTSNFD